MLKTRFFTDKLIVFLLFLAAVGFQYRRDLTGERRPPCGFFPFFTDIFGEKHKEHFYIVRFDADKSRFTPRKYIKKARLLRIGPYLPPNKSLF